jgi:DNA-binding response OmpR family regulator
MPAHGARIALLVVGNEPSLRDTYALLFHRDSYIAHAVALQDLSSTLRGGAFDVVVLDHTLSQEERKTGVHTIRVLMPQSLTVALHSRAQDCGADLVMDSREGPEAILQAVTELVHRARARGSMKAPN